MLKTLFPDSPLDAAERARIAADWRARLDGTPPCPDPLVIFAIPLIGRSRAKDWDTVQRNLARTIASIRNQTSDRWVVHICGQTRPTAIEFDDKVRFLRFRGITFHKVEKGVRGYDQGDKRVRLINAALRQHAGRDGYFARWDGDDLLHPETVAHICADNNGRGYLVERGIMADLDAGLYGRLSPGPEGAGKPFWRMCGSSSFVRFDFRSQPRHWRKLLRRHSSHKGLVEWMRLSGLPLEPLPFDAAIYSYNNGENMSARKGDTATRNRYLTACPLTAVECADLSAAYGLDRILAQPEPVEPGRGIPGVAIPA